MQELSLKDLLTTDDPAWPALRRWLADACNPTNLWTTPRPHGEAALLALQVSAQTTLGAVALYTAGIAVDHGWLRLLGAGGDPLQDGLREWNGLGKASRALPGALMVAHDAIGGFFAVNGGALPGAPGFVFYQSPRTVDWLDLGIGYSRFVHWCLNTDLDAFYAGLRWKGWRDDVRELAPDEGWSFLPQLWAQPDTSGADALTHRRRTTVSQRALWQMEQQAALLRHEPQTPEA